VDQQLKELMKELGQAINESLSDSDQIAEVVSRIKEDGYDIFLVLEATIGVSKQGEKTSGKPPVAALSRATLATLPLPTATGVRFECNECHAKRTVPFAELVKLSTSA
jgi:hypothetical protein